MQTLRLYDPMRRSANWTDSLRPGQLVAFAKRIDSDLPCTPDGEPFAAVDCATCADRDPILPGFVGLNMVLVALRLFWMNQASREAERASRERLARHTAWFALGAEARSATMEAACGEGGSNEPRSPRSTP